MFGKQNLKWGGGNFQQKRKGGTVLTFNWLSKSNLPHPAVTPHRQKF